MSLLFNYIFVYVLKFYKSLLILKNHLLKGEEKSKSCWLKKEEKRDNTVLHLKKKRLMKCLWEFKQDNSNTFVSCCMDSRCIN